MPTSVGMTERAPAVLIHAVRRSTNAPLAWVIRSMGTAEQPFVNQAPVRFGVQPPRLLRCIGSGHDLLIV
jgi:hypothetical protein